MKDVPTGAEQIHERAIHIFPDNLFALPKAVVAVLLIFFLCERRGDSLITQDKVKSFATELSKFLLKKNRLG